jgi:hypothetical protein
VEESGFKDTHGADIGPNPGEKFYTITYRVQRVKTHMELI